MLVQVSILIEFSDLLREYYENDRFIFETKD